jgi:uroporphyrinogen decarboxylase
MTQKIPPDRMTPKERMTAWITGQPYDRIPCKPFLGQNTAKLFGASNRAFNTSPQVMAEVIEGIFKKFRPDSVSINAGLQSIPEALGTKLIFPDYGPPRIDDPGLTDYAVLKDLEPVNPDKDGRFPNFFEALEDVRGRIGLLVPIDFSLGGPFTSAVLLVGLEKFMRDTVHNQEAIHRVMRLTTDSLKNVLSKVAQTETGASLAEPIASTLVVSPRIFKKFVKPYLQELTAFLKDKFSRNLGLHICGKSKTIWSDVAETGVSGFSLDNLESLEEAKNEIGSKVTLIGNVPPVEVLQTGSPSDVFNSAQKCLDEAADSPKGFMLASGCEVAIDTPPENILALMDAARLYGQRNYS